MLYYSTNFKYNNKIIFTVKVYASSPMGDKIEFDELDSANSEGSDENEDLQQQCFVRPTNVKGEDLSAPPMNGEQYLRRVIEEAKKCEAVTLADIKIKLPKEPSFVLPEEKKECQSEFLPDKQFQVSIMADFSKLRLEIESHKKKVPVQDLKKLKKSLPHGDDDEAWLKICCEQNPDITEGAISKSLKLCIAISQVKIWRLLSYFSDWLSEGLINMQNGCRLIYCLLACLELPVEPDIEFSMRQIARVLINHRAQLESVESEELPHINVLVCIIGRYFKQTDLADPY